jgi:Phosphate-starvation-inducible E family
MTPEMQTRRLDDYLRTSEVAIYVILAVLLSITALVTILGAGLLLWQSIVRWTVSTEILRVLDQLLLVLMLVEILHTVRITVRSHIVLAAEPFLVVGLIASIRRILVISLEMSAVSKGNNWAPNGESIFHASILELGLLVMLVLVLVLSITLLRRYAPAPKDVESA